MLVGHNLESDFKMLGITRQQLVQKNVEIFDFADIFKVGAQHCALRDVVYYLCNQKRIQEYDDQERVNEGHNIEIDSRYTLKAYKSYTKMNKEDVKSGSQLRACKSLAFTRSAHFV
jgi:hypothetical protein